MFNFDPGIEGFFLIVVLSAGATHWIFHKLGIPRE